MVGTRTHPIHPMKTEDRHAIERINRTVKPVVIGPPPTLDRILDQRRNIAGTEADELRTEGHVHHRRPLNCPHE